MKDNLFEMLLNLFEKTLTQLKESHVSTSENNAEQGELANTYACPNVEVQSTLIKEPHCDSMRVFTHHEQVKFTKSSYQFLVRMMSWGVIAPDVMELVINQLIFSESNFVSLQETKWTIRNTLANTLDAQQLAFLDLVLYHKEDGLSLH